MPFSDVNIVGEYLSLGDFLFAAVAAIIGVWVTRNVSAFIRGFFTTPEEHRRVQIHRIIQRCHLMFHKTTFSFDGKTFSRGMLIRVVTKKNETFEGRIVGLDDNNTMCIITKMDIMADILDNILEIIVLDDQSVN